MAEADSGTVNVEDIDHQDVWGNEKIGAGVFIQIVK
jgi:hypothetical protein